MTDEAFVRGTLATWFTRAGHRAAASLVRYARERSEWTVLLWEMERPFAIPSPFRSALLNARDGQWAEGRARLKAAGFSPPTVPVDGEVTPCWTDAQDVVRRTLGKHFFEREQYAQGALCMHAVREDEWRHLAQDTDDATVRAVCEALAGEQMDAALEMLAYQAAMTPARWLQNAREEFHLGAP